jgi:hypothetical protein
LLARGGDGVGNTDDARRVDAQLLEELSEVFAQIAMTPDTQSLQWKNSL